MPKTFYFIAGLPRSGSTLLATLLSQNPQIHGEAVSSLSGIIATVNANWMQFDANQEYDNPQAKEGIMRSMLHGYYDHITKPIIIDKDRSWIAQISLLEILLQRPVKIITCVRNPAEILASFERLRKQNPLFATRVDTDLKATSTIESRALWYSNQTGPMGLAHATIKDAVTQGYLDRLLFVDYNRFCNTPRAQIRRIYDFLELPEYQHDFERITQTQYYNDHAVGLPGLHAVKPTLDRTVMNCVEYLGFDLYNQYNGDIFWTAWI